MPRARLATWNVKLTGHRLRRSTWASASPMASPSCGAAANEVVARMTDDFDRWARKGNKTPAHAPVTLELSL
jgi:hypothetical protein